MGVVPNDRLAKIQFYETRLSPWGLNAAALNLAPADLTNFTPKVEAARAAYNAHDAAQAAARAATQEYYDRVREMHSDPGGGAALISKIKSYAELTGNPNVYTLAQIPPPAAPSVVPPPGQPFAFQVFLETSGAIGLKWKCVNPKRSVGTVYEIMRKSGGQTVFTYVGSAGLKTFVDSTLTAAQAVSPVTYQITAVRSTVRGKPGAFSVNFGVGGVGGAAGFVVTSVTEAGPGEVKMAA